MWVRLIFGVFSFLTHISFSLSVQNCSTRLPPEFGLSTASERGLKSNEDCITVGLTINMDGCKNSSHCSLGTQNSLEVSGVNMNENIV